MFLFFRVLDVCKRMRERLALGIFSPYGFDDSIKHYFVLKFKLSLLSSANFKDRSAHIYLGLFAQLLPPMQNKPAVYHRFKAMA